MDKLYVTTRTWNNKNITIMGCKISSQLPTSAESNARSLPDPSEVMADRLPEPAPPAPVDSRLPLDARQVFKLKKSWKGIKRCMEATGIEMFIRMFRSNQEIKQMFLKFRDIKSDDDLRMNEMLEKHATIVMSTIDEAINNIDNVDYLLSLLKTASHLHKDFNNFVPQLFLAIEQPFLEAVKITLDDRYSDNMDIIYRITVKFLLETMMKSLTACNADGDVTEQQRT